jgi:hypothetical protein
MLGWDALLVSDHIVQPIWSNRLTKTFLADKCYKLNF